MGATALLEDGKMRSQCEPTFCRCHSLNKTPLPPKKKGCCGPSCIPIVIILAVVVVIFLVPHQTLQRSSVPESLVATTENPSLSEHTCSLQIVESIPLGLNYSEGSPKFMSTIDAWQKLLGMATDSIDIGSFYWTMRGVDVVNHSSAAPGEEIFNQLLSNGATKKNKIRIAESFSKDNVDTKILADNGAASVRSVNFEKLLGGGVLHTKLWIVDEKHFYLGSANMDWRALTQVKELGVLAQNCSELARDLMKVFEAYWYLGQEKATIPKEWAESYSTSYNTSNPMTVHFNNDAFTMSTFLSSSPPPLSARGRTDDLDAILQAILSAESFVNIAVMDYFPLLIYTKKMRYWSHIDDALRTAAVERKVKIKMLISWWPHSRPAETYFLKSLESLSSVFHGVDIQIRRFVVPADEDQKKIPFSRVNHNKYMVTDNTAYIGTSNWSGDYFTDTAGVGLVLRDSGSQKNGNIRKDLLSLFQRDWQSPYSVELESA